MTNQTRAAVALIAILVVIGVVAYSFGGGSYSASPTTSNNTLGTSSSGSGSSSSFPYGGGPFNTAGNMLITDQFNNRVIEVNPQNNQIVWSFGSGNESPCNPGAGSIIGPNDAERLAGGLTLIAGTGIPAGVPAPACADNRVIIVDQQGNIVWQYGQAGINGSGADQLNVPVFAIQAPNNDILIVDQGNNRVIEVNYATKHVDWSYGPASGSGQLSNPNAAQILGNGDVLIADQNNNRVIEVNPQTNQTAWQYSTGLQTAADASRLPNNDTLIADAGHSRIVEISPQGNVVWQFFTNSSEGSNANPYPSNAVRLEDGLTSIADTVNNRCVVVSSAGQVVYQYGKTNTPGVGSNELNWPYSCYLIGDYTGQTPPPGIESNGSSASSASGTRIAIPAGTGSDNGLNFSPATITVVVGVNNTITWTNNDSTVHTVTSTTVPEGVQPFNDANLGPGQSYSITLTVPGTYQYQCSIHSWMKATIIVKP